MSAHARSPRDCLAMFETTFAQTRAAIQSRARPPSRARMMALDRAGTICLASNAATDQERSASPVRPPQPSARMLRGRTMSDQPSSTSAKTLPPRAARPTPACGASVRPRGVPLMSYGGSGILANCVALAILLRIDWENRQLKRGIPA